MTERLSKLTSNLECFMSNWSNKAHNMISSSASSWSNFLATKLSGSKFISSVERYWTTMFMPNSPRWIWWSRPCPSQQSSANNASNRLLKVCQVSSPSLPVITKWILLLLLPIGMLIGISLQRLIMWKIEVLMSSTWMVVWLGHNFF